MDIMGRRRWKDIVGRWRWKNIMGRRRWKNIVGRRRWMDIVGRVASTRVRLRWWRNVSRMLVVTSIMELR